MKLFNFLENTEEFRTNLILNFQTSEEFIFNRGLLPSFILLSQQSKVFTPGKVARMALFQKNKTRLFDN